MAIGTTVGLAIVAAAMVGVRARSTGISTAIDSGVVIAPQPDSGTGGIQSEKVEEPVGQAQEEERTRMDEAAKVLQDREEQSARGASAQPLAGKAQKSDEPQRPLDVSTVVKRFESLERRYQATSHPSRLPVVALQVRRKDVRDASPEQLRQIWLWLDRWEKEFLPSPR